MSSHDFASTYVGTPFYMSPEICAAERYTLKSDVWSLGCIIYELCSREPPFNAKSHYQLVQKIKEGKTSSLPKVYSKDLYEVIKSCLRVNPDERPSTADLLNLPVVRLMRKEKEVVEMNKILKAKEDTLNKRMAELERKLATADATKNSMRHEIESSLRREWEVKARLEIDRLVTDEMESLRQRFEAEVVARVQEELQKKTVSFGPVETQEFTSSIPDHPHSISGHSTDADGDFPSTTDITELSIDSPEQLQPLKKSARTPFGRAQTMFAGHLGTPMDIEMASPSPIPLAALSLSPRRNAATKAPTSNPDIFAAGDSDRFRNAEPVLSDSEDDDEPILPSPSRNVRSNKNPFGPRRPGLTTTKTAPMGQLKANPLNLNKAVPSLPPATQSRPGSNGPLRERNSSPNRRLSKIPSAANLMAAAQNSENGTGLTRKNSQKESSDNSPSKLGSKPNVRGRTLIELQQARAGGRAPEVSPKRNNSFKDRAATRDRSPVAVWDPEKDEMPSPFLQRKKPMVRV